MDLNIKVKKMKNFIKHHQSQMTIPVHKPTFKMSSPKLVLLSNY